MSDSRSSVSSVTQPERAGWMRVLALADAPALEAAAGRLGPLPSYRHLRRPESGMAMVRGRAGGTGAQFNLGEMTLTRCAVTLATPEARGVIGMAYVQARSQRHAELAAVLDALLQLPAWHARVRDEVIAPLAQAHDAAALERARVAAQTKVEFFTMVRGED